MRDRSWEECFIDSHSKWLEVLPVRAATSEETIEKLKRLFSTFGIPDKIVSDNGSVFTSGEFETFLKNNGIVHIRISPYHPSSNGLAERAVQIFKKAIERQREGTIETKLSRFLFSYRGQLHNLTTISPAEMLFGRKLKTRLDLLHPDLQSSTINQTLLDRRKSTIGTQNQDKWKLVIEYMYGLLKRVHIGSKVKFIKN